MAQLVTLAANWDLFRMFIGVVRAGSASRAAVELGISQPTLSRRLAELERYIGAPLFYRSSSGLKLTKEGEELRYSTQSLTDAFGALERNLRDRVAARNSIVRISTTEAITRHWLLSRIAILQKQRTDLSLEVVSTYRKQDIPSGDFDFVIRIGNPDDEELIGKRVGTIAFGIFASQKYLDGSPTIASVADLKKHKIIGSASDFPAFKGDGTERTRLIDHFRAAAQGRSAVRVLPIINHYGAAVEGLGLAYLAAPFAAKEGLVRVLPRERALMDVWLLWRRECDLRKSARDVRRFLEQEFAASVGLFVQAGGELRPPRKK
ncbi:LysR family transcriptional regulator [Bradyrhizobium sp. USDA 4502]